MNRVWIALAVAGALVVSGAAGWSFTKPPEYVPERFQARLHAWRLLHPTYRWARDADCRCDEDLFNQRTVSAGIWKADPNYRPYLAHGDMDGDGLEDVAVGVKPVGAASTYRVLILSGRSDADPYLSEPFKLNEAMFFGPPRLEPYRLLVGPFETEVGAFEPEPGGGYRYVGDDCC